MGKISEEKEKAIIKAYKAGVNVRALVKLLKISSRTLYVVLDRNDVPTRYAVTSQIRKELGLSD